MASSSNYGTSAAPFADHDRIKQETDSFEYQMIGYNIIAMNNFVEAKPELLDLSASSHTPLREAYLYQNVSPSSDYHTPLSNNSQFPNYYAVGTPSSSYQVQNGGYSMIKQEPVQTVPVDPFSPVTMQLNTGNSPLDFEEAYEEGTFECHGCKTKKKYSVFIKDEMYCLPCASHIKEEKVCSGVKIPKAEPENQRVMRATRCTRPTYKVKEAASPYQPRGLETITFTCEMCNQDRRRKHYIGEQLCCRSCYHKHKPQESETKKCDNCDVQSENSYYRSKFCERLCHNCFHYKLRTGMTRPI